MKGPVFGGPGDALREDEINSGHNIYVQRAALGARHSLMLPARVGPYEYERERSGVERRPPR